MGLVASLFEKLSGEKERKLVVVGLEGAGKSTILQKLQLAEITTTSSEITPFIRKGVNVEHVKDKNIRCMTFDVGGSDEARPLWSTYFRKTEGLIFVVDCNDRERVGEAREELNWMLNEDSLKDVVLLVFANKQDVAGTMSAEELKATLGSQCFTNRTWNIQATSAVSGDGLNEGLDWLTTQMQNQ